MPRIKLCLKYLLGVLFIVAGANHFVNMADYEQIMPPYLPWHRELVLVSGLFEVALGCLLMWRTWSRLAAWGLVALLVAVFPANLHMAMNPELFADFSLRLLWFPRPDSHLSPTALWLRLPVQGLLIAWAYWYTGGIGHGCRTQPGSRLS